LDDGEIVGGGLGGDSAHISLAGVVNDLEENGAGQALTAGFEIYSQVDHAGDSLGDVNLSRGGGDDLGIVLGDEGGAVLYAGNDLADGE
jgi:hypothetical protein